MSLDEDVALAYHEYLSAYDELLELLRKSEMSVMKGMLSFKLTERDEIKFALFENKRLALSCAEISDGDGDLKLKLKSKSTLKHNIKNSENIENIEKEKERKSIDNNFTLQNRHHKGIFRKKVITNEEEDDNVNDSNSAQLNVINPIQLIHGGFTSLSIRQSQNDMNITIVQIINVINKKRKIEKLLLLLI